MKTDPAPRPKILILVSGQGTNLQALIEASRERDYPADIIAVGSNRAAAPALAKARQFNIPTFVIEHDNYASRDEFDGALMQEIRRHNPDLIVLAGFMRILTADFVRALRGQLLNIHPSLLPKYPGLNTHQRALDAGDSLHGVSVHFVTEEVDGGPLIAQAQVVVSPTDNADTLAQKIQAQEHVLYPIVVRWCCEGRIQLGGEQVLFDGQPLSEPLLLPAES